MSSRNLAAALLVAAVVPVGAQQQQTADAGVINSKQQVRTFETVLRNAVENAGERLAQAAQQVYRILQLGFQADPIVSGIYNPQVGPHFDVQIPQIHGAARSLMDYGKPKPEAVLVSPKTDPPAGTGENPVSRTVATAVVKDDPMTVSPATFDPDKLYTEFVLESLKDAMLDYSAALQVKETERLTIVAREMEIPGMQNPLFSSSSRKLVLYIKGDDLAAFRAGRINRDEAKQRIVDFRF